eukprot:402319_1
MDAPPGSEQLYWTIDATIKKYGNLNITIKTCADFENYQLGHPDSNNYSFAAYNYSIPKVPFVITSPRIITEKYVVTNMNDGYLLICTRPGIFNDGYLTYDGMEILRRTYNERGYPKKWEMKRKLFQQLYEIPVVNINKDPVYVMIVPTQEHCDRILTDRKRARSSVFEDENIIHRTKRIKLFDLNDLSNASNDEKLEVNPANANNDEQEVDCDYDLRTDSLSVHF